MIVGGFLCRYLTVLYFLNAVEEGGETAFPVADNETFDEEVRRFFIFNYKFSLNLDLIINKQKIRATMIKYRLNTE